MIFLLFFMILILFLLLFSIDLQSSRRKRVIREKEDCYNKPYNLNGDCVDSCPVFINENNIDCIDNIPPNKYALGNKIVSKCPMYYTDARMCGFPLAKFVSSAISKDGKYKTLITADGFVVCFNNLEWNVYNHSAIFNNVVKLISNESSNKLIVLNSNNVYISTNYGKTWSLLLTPDVKVIDVDMHPDGKIVFVIDRTGNDASIIYTIESLNEDGSLNTVKIFQNILFDKISIGKFQTENYSDYFVIFKTQGNKIFENTINQDDQMMIIRGISSSSNEAYLLNFYYTFDDIRTKPNKENISHIEISKDARIIYVITTENTLTKRNYLYTGIVSSQDSNSIVNLYRTNNDIGSLIHMKSSYDGKNNIGVVYDEKTKSKFCVNFRVEYDQDIFVGNPLNVTYSLTNLKGDFSSISLSCDSVLNNDGKYQLVCENYGYLFESKDYGNNFDMMK